MEEREKLSKLLKFLQTRHLQMQFTYEIRKDNINVERKCLSVLSYFSLINIDVNHEQIFDFICIINYKLVA